MNNRLPDDVAQKVKRAVYKAADDQHYLAMNRVQSGNFMNQLVDRAEIGGKLADFMQRSAVRTYIKDTILNRYSKDKAQEACPDDVSSIIQSLMGMPVYHVGGDASVSLFRSASEDSGKDYVIVSDGTYTKWETALRKALLFAVTKPFRRNASRTHILLLLYSQGRVIAPADKKCVSEALAMAGVKAFFY